MPAQTCRRRAHLDWHPRGKARKHAHARARAHTHTPRKAAAWCRPRRPQPPGCRHEPSYPRRTTPACAQKARCPAPTQRHEPILSEPRPATRRVGIESVRREPSLTTRGTQRDETRCTRRRVQCLPHTVLAVHLVGHFKLRVEHGFAILGQIPQLDKAIAAASD